MQEANEGVSARVDNARVDTGVANSVESTRVDIGVTNSIEADSANNNAVEDEFVEVNVENEIVDFVDFGQSIDSSSLFDEWDRQWNDEFSDWERQQFQNTVLRFGDGVNMTLVDYLEKERRGDFVEEKFEKYFGYLARYEENFRTTTLFFF